MSSPLNVQLFYGDVLFYTLYNDVDFHVVARVCLCVNV